MISWNDDQMIALFFTGDYVGKGDLMAATNLGGSPSRARDWPGWPTPPLLSRDCIYKLEFHEKPLNSDFKTTTLL